MHHSRICFLPEGSDIRLIPHESYVKLLRGEQPFPEYAHQTVRVADWYVALKEGAAPLVENETYSLLAFDTLGDVDWPNCHHGITMNRAFHDAIKNSTYDDVDEDPVVQALRRELREEFAWLPSGIERERLHATIFGVQDGGPASTMA